MSRITRDFSQPDEISKEATEKMVGLLKSGRLHRYQGSVNYVSEAEEQMGKYLEAPFCLAVNSGGSSLFLALKLSGVEAGTPVLTNSYTLAPVPGAILHAGGTPVLVDCDTNTFQISVESLRAQQSATGAKHLLLTYMRGKLPDMEGVLAVVKERDLVLVEDCAHVMGSLWRGRALGTLGLFGCFSTQTNKLINSGEGGFLVTAREDLMASAIIHSGSYGHHGQHLSRPGTSELQTKHSTCPNFSLRLTNMAAVLVLDQIPLLGDKIERFNQHYNILEERLGSSSIFQFPARQAEESFVGTSFQFRLDSQDYEVLQQFQRCCLDRGVKLAWFGAREVNGFTSSHKHWSYVETETADLPETDDLLLCLYDIPLYHTASWPDAEFHTIADILMEEAGKLMAG